MQYSTANATNSITKLQILHTRLQKNKFLKKEKNRKNRKKRKKKERKKKTDFKTELFERQKPNIRISRTIPYEIRIL